MPDNSASPADVKPDADTAIAPTVAPGDTSQATPQSYPLLPLTVVPKPDASPIALNTHEANRHLLMLALLLTILSAVTLVMWRYHRRDYASPRRTGRRI